MNHPMFGKTFKSGLFVFVCLVLGACNSTIGGTATGLDGTVVLQNNGGDDLTLSTDGAFTFSTPVPLGQTYDVTVLTQPTGQLCTVANGSGTAMGQNVTNVVVTCGDLPVGGLMDCFNPDLFEPGTTYEITWDVNKSNTQPGGGTWYNSEMYEVTETRTVLGTTTFYGNAAITVDVTVTPAETGTSERLEHGGHFLAYYAVPDTEDILNGQIRYLGSEVYFGEDPEFWETATEAQILRFGLVSEGQSFEQEYTLSSRKRTGSAAPFSEENAEPVPVNRTKHTVTYFDGIIENVGEIFPEDIDWPECAGAIPRGGVIPAGPVDVCKVTVDSLAVPNTGADEPFLYAGAQETLNVCDADRADLYLFLSKDTGLPVFVEFARLQTGNPAFYRFRMVRAYINGVLVHGEEPE